MNWRTPSNAWKCPLSATNSTLRLGGYCRNTRANSSRLAMPAALSAPGASDGTMEMES
jgi:hypothetical protein